MSPLDNSAHVGPFVADTFDGDTFWYTELLDRSKRSGNNKGRIVRTFFHRDRTELLKQMPDVIRLCDFTGARAYTRLAPRSFRTVGMEFTRLVVEAALTSNWQGLRHAYGRACGTAKPIKRLWLFDADDSAQIEACQRLVPSEHLVGVIPSRKGSHFITRPFDMRAVGAQLAPYGVQLHKDNPTNLYIPGDVT